MSQVKRDQNAVTNVKSVRTEISLLCKQTKYLLHWFALIGRDSEAYLRHCQTCILEATGLETTTT